MNKKSEKAIVLMSGGIDSTACAAFLKAQGKAVTALFVDYTLLPNVSLKQRELSRTSFASNSSILYFPAQSIPTLGRCSGEIRS